MTQSEFREMVLRKCDGDFIYIEDGSCLFFPEQGCGGYSAAALRVIAEELERRNKESSSE